MTLTIDRRRLPGYVFLSSVILALTGLGVFLYVKYIGRAVFSSCGCVGPMSSAGIGFSPGSYILLAILGLFLSGLVYALSAFARDLLAVRSLERQALHGSTMEIIGGFQVYMTDSPVRHAWSVGVVRSRVYVSRSAFAKLGEWERTALLEHERSHIRNHDILKRMSMDFLRRLFFFLPTLQEIAASLRFGQEVRADRDAMSATNRKTLCSLYLSASREGFSPAQAAGFAFSSSRLAEVLDGRAGWVSLSLRKLVFSVAMSAVMVMTGFVGLRLYGAQASALATNDCSLLQGSTESAPVAWFAMTVGQSQVAQSNTYILAEKTSAHDVISGSEWPDVMRKDESECPSSH